MRGKHTNGKPTAWEAGITPADAGKTNGGMRNEDHHEDHPRGCGENAFVLLPKAAEKGSPPRMRGKQHQRLPVIFCPRITPADAGKT